MRTIRTSCLRNKRGTSTILGTLIFIGILFTAVIPMYLVMKQADTIYEKKTTEMKRLDEERDIEALQVNVYPLSQYLGPLNVTVINKCGLPVTFVRLWVNDDHSDLDKTAQPMNSIDLAQIEVSPTVDSSYNIEVITMRGNTFVSETGTLHYGSDGWYADFLAINVAISSQGVHFQINITKGDDIIYDEQVTKTSGSVTYIKTYYVSTPGEYHVKIMKSGNTIHEETVNIEWYKGYPAVWVYS